jgi:CHASE3 domain sensor protein
MFMSKKKGINPLAVGLGLALGAAGAVFLSKKENRSKVKKAVKSIQKDQGQRLVSMVGQLINDFGTIQQQNSLDTKKKSSGKGKK